MTKDEEVAIMAYIAFTLRYCRPPKGSMTLYEELRRPVIAWMAQLKEPNP